MEATDHPAILVCIRSEAFAQVRRLVDRFPRVRWAVGQSGRMVPNSANLFIEDLMDTDDALKLLSVRGFTHVASCGTAGDKISLRPVV